MVNEFRSISDEAFDTNPFYLMRQDIKLALPLSDFDAQDSMMIDWIDDPVNVFEVMEVHNYVQNHELTNGVYEIEALEFVALTLESNFEFNELYHLRQDLDKKCQANKIIDLVANTDSPLTNFAQNIFFGNDDYNLSFEDIDLPITADANANTKLPVGLNFNSASSAVIQYDNNYLDDATDLSFVMTTAHELVHVYLAYLYSEGQLLQAYPGYTDLNNAFIVFQNDSSVVNGISLADAMHEVYDDFLDWIAQSVFTYVQDNDIENVTQDYCNKLVIGSHQYTEAFQNLNSTDQSQYSIIATNEENGTEQANGTTCD